MEKPVETKDTSTLRRLALMAGNGAALLFIAQRVFGEPALDFEIVPRFYAGAALAFLGLMFAYLSLYFERRKVNADWFEILSALGFASLMIAWIMPALR
jgi:hypothetical protein